MYQLRKFIAGCKDITKHNNYLQRYYTICDILYRTKHEHIYRICTHFMNIFTGGQNNRKKMVVFVAFTINSLYAISFKLDSDCKKALICRADIVSTPFRNYMYDIYFADNVTCASSLLTPTSSY